VQPHSYLSATSGSTFMARRAGTRHASKATNSNNAETLMNVTVSLRETSELETLDHSLSQFGHGYTSSEKLNSQTSGQESRWLFY
jgi:hypothetical protein